MNQASIFPTHANSCMPQKAPFHFSLFIIKKLYVTFQSIFENSKNFKKHKLCKINPAKDYEKITQYSLFSFAHGIDIMHQISAQTNNYL